MASTYTANATFRAVDKVTPAMRNMSRSTGMFGQKANATFAKVQMQSQRLNGTFNRLTGTLGKLGLAFGAMQIGRVVIDANVELDKSLASLSAITGKTGKEFEAFTKQVGVVSKAQMAFAGDTAKAFEVVASAQPVLLENADALGKVTNAAITLSKASGDELAQSALSLTGVMNQFNLQATESERVMNVLAAGSVAGSANISNVAASMKNFGAVANAANITVEESVALVEVLGSKSIFAEEAGTKLRGAILKLQQAGVGYKSGVFNINDALEESRKKLNSFTTAKEKDAYLLKTFGAMNITTGQILLSNIDKFNELTTAVTGTTTATQQAEINSNTLANRWKELNDAFKNAVTSTNSENKALNSLKNILKFAAKNMDKIVGVAIKAIKIFIAYKTVVLAVAAAQKLHMAILVVAKFVKFVRVIGMITRAKGLWAAAQWALNVAMNANPIGLIIMAIGGLVLAVRWVVKNWEKFKASLLKMADIAKTVGKAMVLYLLTPLQLFLKLIGKTLQIDFAIKGAEKIEEIKQKIIASDERLMKAQTKFNNMVDYFTGDESEASTTRAAEARENVRREERITQSTNSLTITNKTGFEANLEAAPGAPIKLENTN